ncbi:MAG: class I SAM-dependent methyltransferase [Prolixibacteraceae bacterium]|nr:class I SAM-dependent methyltransferase [Prolixibacteraceae bacterium]
MRNFLIYKILQLYLLNLRAGFRAFLKGFDYFRFREYVMAIKQISIEAGCHESLAKLLDVGCGEEIWGVFASKVLPFKVIAIDVSMEKLALQKKIASRLNAVSFFPTQADATNMLFSANSFEIINCFAVLPLLPDNGDIMVMKEIGRVLKKSGRAYITVGYGSQYKEQIDTASTRGFSRVYNEEALLSRLVDPSGLRVVKKFFFTEPGFKFSELWFKMPFLLKLPFRWMMPVFTSLFLKEYDPLLSKSEDLRGVQGVFLVLKK